MLDRYQCLTYLLLKKYQMCLNCPQMVKSMTRVVEDLGWDKEMEVAGMEIVGLGMAEAKKAKVDEDWVGVGMRVEEYWVH